MPRYAAIDIGSNSVRMEAAEVIEDAISLAAQGVQDWLHQGIQECMNKYNGDKP